MSFDAFSIVIDKKAIENMDFSMIKQYIEDRDFDETLLYEAVGKLDISFYGYDNDPREIYEIPEIQNWVKASMLEEKIPWFFFLSTAPTSQSLKALAYCFIAEPVEVEGGGMRFQPLKKNLRDFAIVNFSNMNDFMKNHSLTSSINAAITDNVNKYFSTWLENS
jgi:hypothetical protein